MNTVKFDLYQQVTDQVIEMLETGGLAKWQSGWAKIGIYPTNFDTKAKYKGVNILVLGMVAAIKGYSSNSWLTAKQAFRLGGKIKKGEKATRAIFFKPLETEDRVKEGEVTKPRFVISYFNLFNMDQIEGIEVPLQYVPLNHEPDQQYQVLMGMAQSIKVDVNHQLQNNAYYMVSTDKVVLPEIDQFESMSTLNATFAHELIHATGAAHRTGRLGKIYQDMKIDEKDQYAFEELVAELGATFLTVHLGIDYNMEFHASYIESWLTHLRKNKKLVFSASRLAQNALEFMINAVEVKATGESTAIAS